MPVNDERLAAKVERVRTREREQARRRFGDSLPPQAFSDRSLQSLTEHFNEAELARVLAHPAYPAVARRLAEIGIPRKADNGVVVHALRDIFRLMTGVWALYLHATPGGFTHSRLDALCRFAGEGGRGRTHALVAYMRFLGYVEPEDAGHDGRERRYRPTTRMRRAFQAFFADHLEAIAPLVPEATVMRDRIGDDAAFDLFMAEVGEGLMIMGMIARLHQGPSLNAFSRRRSGLVMLWVLLLAAPPSETWPSSAAYPITVAEVARRAGVSRTHVIRLLREGEAQGMMILEEPGRFQATPLLRQEVDTYLALLVIALGACARDVLAGGEAESRPRAAAAS